MKIRTRLTLIFFTIVIVVLSVICMSIYFFSENYRREEFTRRLRNRATNAVKILTEVKEVDADLLRRLERNNPASLPRQYIAIYDRNGHMRYTSENTPPVPIDTSLINAIANGREVDYVSQAFEVLGFTFGEGNTRYTVVAAASDEYGTDALQNLRNILLATFSASILIVGLLGWFFSGRVLNPIARIVDQVSIISEANLSNRLDEGTNKDELSRLSHTFNRMLARLQAAFTSQKHFIANASHEIKTPITVMIGEIEVTLLQPRPDDYYRKVLLSTLGGLKGLNRLSTQLLQLAQASAENPDKNFSTIRIDDVLWEVKEELTKAFTGCRVDIDLDLQLDPESLAVDGDEQLMKVAMLNLLDNGCKFSPNHHVRVRLERDNGNNILMRFVNAGRGIPDEELKRIFEPFYRGHGSEKIKGSGIGLSLVNRIVRLHNGTISVHSVPDHVTEFQVRLPIR